ncbi:hypothetical protein ACTZWW_10625 [Salinarimonas sp. NSM]|uniref:hypothetical protein n=1 Tax=Salinarimonas sp. NSM TaxID=3458003 RepID=UPI00403736AD
MVVLVILDERALERARAFPITPDTRVVTLSSMADSVAALGAPVVVAGDADLGEDAFAGCARFVEAFEAGLARSGCEALAPHVNNIYYFFVRPILWLLAAIARTTAGTNAEIVLFGGHPKVELPCVYGVAILEQNRAILARPSQVMNPYLYQALAPTHRVTFLAENALVLRLRRFARRLAVPTALMVKLVEKHLRARAAHGVVHSAVAATADHAGDDRADVVVPVRSAAQIRYVRGAVALLHARGYRVRVLVHQVLGDRQLALDAARSALPAQTIRSLMGARPLATFAAGWAKAIVRGAFGLVGTRASLRLGEPGAAFDVSLRQLTRDTRAFFNFDTWRDVLADGLDRHAPGARALLSLELTSSQAFQEAALAEARGMAFANVQIGPLEHIPHPALSVGGTFLTLSEDDARAFARLGVRNRGTCRFIGPLKYLGMIADAPKPVAAPTSWRTVLCLTQPYEYHNQIAVIRTLLAWLAAHAPQARLLVRLHGRDTVETYAAFRDDPRFVLGDPVSDIYDEMRAADVVVARTTSAIDEAIHLGVPFVSCAFSQFDRELELPYLDPASGLVCASPEALAARLSDWRGLDAAFAAMRARYLARAGSGSDAELIDRLIDVLALRPGGR